MRPSRRFPYPLALALVGTARAADNTPVAVIEGETKVPEGGSILLSGIKSVSDRPLEWKLIGRKDEFTLIPAGERPDVFLWMSDVKQGEYVFALIARYALGTEAIEVDVAIHRVVVVPAPEPCCAAGCHRTDRDLF
jgi:hypothetical protein